MKKETAKKIVAAMGQAFARSKANSFFSPKQFLKTQTWEGIRASILRTLLPLPEPTSWDLKHSLRLLDELLEQFETSSSPEAWKVVYDDSKNRRTGRPRKLPFEKACAACHKLDKRAGEQQKVAVSEVAKEYGISPRELMELRHERRLCRQVDRDMRIEIALTEIARRRFAGFQPDGTPH
ncbi:MAG TPA: hypothetical protein VMV59_12435 [Candidatus Dormibacteraeota bacterium]|nr:hypothetical protein [Candidatus Dormibacteraeota bacterium]